MVIQGHEERVDDDAECDEELDERIEDQQRHVLLELEPDPATIPNAKNIDATQKHGQGLFLKRGALLIVVCRKVIDRNCILRVSKLKNAPLFFGEKSFFIRWFGGCGRGFFRCRFPYFGRELGEAYTGRGVGEQLRSMWMCVSVCWILSGGSSERF